MTSHSSSKISGFGHYIPEQRIESAEMEKWFNLEKGWIERRTGIKTRYWAHTDETIVDLAQKAGEIAIKNSGIERNSIGLTILATSTPDHLLPPSSPMLAHRLNLVNSGAFDLSGACSGFIYAFTLADSFVRTHNKSVLIVAANILSRRINLEEHKSAVLFGDAAGAVVLSPSKELGTGVLGMNFASDGKEYNLISIAAGGSQKPFHPNIPLHEYKMQMYNGKAIFNHAIQMMANCASIAMENAKINFEDLDRFVPHQANARMIENLAKKLNIPEKKIISTVCKFGNSSAASIPVSLSIANISEPFVSGEKILLCSAGAGMTGGAILIGI